MWAVYFIGPTDSFLQAMFVSFFEAGEWGENSGRKLGFADGDFELKFWPNLENIDTSDTGWEQSN